MEFATEMIIKANLHGARISEIPITLHPDGRKTQAPHLRTIRDGWRTLLFFSSLAAIPLSGAGLFPSFARADWIRPGIAWIENRRCYVRCSYTFVSNPPF